MPTVSLNAAAMVFDGAESDAPALRRDARVLAARPVVAFLPLSRGALWLFLPHLGDRLRGMGYIALHNGSVRAWRGGKSALNCMDGNPLPR
jgi:hypothetical protein